MNQRFENLAEQAMVHVPGQTGLHTRAFSLEKFAELIVKECANRATWAQDTGEADVGGEVLKHFGVEE
jgi:hypothetical protein